MLPLNGHVLVSGWAPERREHPTLGRKSKLKTGLRNPKCLSSTLPKAWYLETKGSWAGPVWSNHDTAQHDGQTQRYECVGCGHLPLPER